MWHNLNIYLFETLFASGMLNSDSLRNTTIFVSISGWLKWLEFAFYLTIVILKYTGEAFPAQTFPSGGKITPLCDCKVELLCLRRRPRPPKLEINSAQVKMAMSINRKRKKRCLRGASFVLWSIETFCINYWLDKIRAALNQYMNKLWIIDFRLKVNVIHAFSLPLLLVGRNPNEPQDEKLRLSKERNRFKSVNWEPYDKKQRKYMEIGESKCFSFYCRSLFSIIWPKTIGSKPKMKSQFRAHRMAVLLQLLPELQRTGQHDVQQGHGILTPEGLETAGTGSGSGLSLPAWINGSYIDVTKERTTPSGTKEVTCVVPQPHTPTASPSTSNATTTVNNGTSSQGSQAGNSGSVTTSMSDSTVYSTALSVTIGIDSNRLVH